MQDHAGALEGRDLVIVATGPSRDLVDRGWLRDTPSMGMNLPPAWMVGDDRPDYWLLRDNITGEFGKAVRERAQKREGSLVIVNEVHWVFYKDIKPDILYSTKKDAACMVSGSSLSLHVALDIARVLKPKTVWLVGADGAPVDKDWTHAADCADLYADARFRQREGHLSKYKQRVEALAPTPVWNTNPDALHQDIFPFRESPAQNGHEPRR